MARYFELIKNDEVHVFSGDDPQDAASKAARRFGKKGSIEVRIELREHGQRNRDGTYTLHQFKIGYREKKAPKDAPEWLGATIKEPMIKKTGVRCVKYMPKAKGSSSRNHASAVEQAEDELLEFHTPHSWHENW